MKSSSKSILILIVGVIVCLACLFDMLREQSDDVIDMGAKDGTSFFYLVVGILLCVAGVMGMIKENKKKQRRRY